MAGETITPREPVTVDVGNVHARQMVVGGTVAGAFGLIALAAAVTGNVDGGTGVRITAFALGLLFTLIGVLPLLMWRVAFRPRRLVLDVEGLRWEDPRGIPWAVGWAELSRVTFSFPKPDTGRPGIPPPVELVLRPAEASFRDAHPEMAHLAVETSREPGVVYRLPLGHAQSAVGPIDEALTAFASGLYRRRGVRSVRRRVRPRAVEVSVGILATYWMAAVTGSVVQGMADDLKSAAIMIFWTLAVGIWLMRVLAGGPLAVGRMAHFGTAIGVVLLAGMAMLAFVLIPAKQDFQIRELWVFLPGLGAGGGLLLAGRLLARRDVREWAESRGQGR
ncbi:hypothetical protein E1200_16230 [Actinomadura sp. GC306]|uniref:hypothetical protein n=1 Tax=Actinomadura sp. GC306 TaxID=2530367 RepID=UPI0010511480|nr:hypothetical protein [Actinomadura sp. GC306]TDC66724.1 hypothetical protein E1200_16230 [Actinomadura sp. GC306]